VIRNRAIARFFFRDVRMRILRRTTFAGKLHAMSFLFRASPSVSKAAVQPQIVTSAYMAAGMTSRARRPEPRHTAG